MSSNSTFMMQSRNRLGLGGLLFVLFNFSTVWFSPTSGRSLTQSNTHNLDLVTKLSLKIRTVDIEIQGCDFVLIDFILDNSISCD